MILFKEKEYSKMTSVKKVAKEGAKGMANPLAWVGAAGSTAGVANYAMQKKRAKQSDEQHKELMKQNDRLIKALGGVEKGLNNIPQSTSQTQKPNSKDNSWLKIGGRKIFSEKKEKSFGIVSKNAINGATTGATLGTLATPLTFLTKNKIPLAGPLIGAALGGLIGTGYGIVKTIDQAVSQLGTGHSLVSEVVKNLNRSGLKRDQDWTMDPKMSTLMKTRVCIVISRNAAELNLLVNMASEPKLKLASDEILKNLPERSQKTEKISDRFNDIQITSIPNKKDAVYISSIIEGCIKRGFPVYLMEVG